MSELDQRALENAIRAGCIAGPECRYPCDSCTEEPCPCRGVTIVPAAITAYLSTRREQGWVEIRSDELRNPHAVRMVHAIEAEREACAQIADAYADENITMAGDAVLHDPVLSGEPLTGANVAKSKDRMIEGCIHSSMFHASQNIAAAIRSRTKADPT